MLKIFSGTCTTPSWISRVSLAVFAAIILLPTAPDAKTIKIGALEGSANSIPVEIILREAYGRLNIGIEVSYYPARRSLQLANRGTEYLN